MAIGRDFLGQVWHGFIVLMLLTAFGFVAWHAFGCTIQHEVVIRFETPGELQTPDEILEDVNDVLDEAIGTAVTEP